MRYLDQIVKQTQKAVDDICRTAEAMPLDKENWTPGEHARSALQQMQEVAAQAAWFLPIIRERRVPEGQHEIQEAMKARASYDTIAKCVEAARSSTAELCQAITEFPEGKLDEEVTLPFGGGTVVTMADVLSLPAWNAIYHLGQINQIQLMLGDREMH
ncbi:MAG TPA: DinB family protein [Fimbriimonadaceae bacterium]|nr:DinB family protein [Fimbriimonadaceae bacterium]